MSDAKQPRRRNRAQTRAKILAAAQLAFAETGYAHAGIRQIATLAGVDSALIQHYFGSKAGLFEAALAEAVPLIEAPDLSTAELESRLTAESLAGFFDLRAQSMIVLSVSDTEARAICAKVLQARAIEPLARALGPPDATTRAIRVVMLMTGFMLFTRQVQLMTPEQAEENGSSHWLSGLVKDVMAKCDGA